MAYPFLQDVIQDVTGWDVSVPVPTFGFLVAVAVFTGIRISQREAERLEELGVLRTNPPKVSEQIFEFAMISTLAGMLGARLFHILEYPAEFMRDPLGMLWSRGGFTIYGGWLVGIPVGVWYAIKKKMPLGRTADISSLGLIWSYAVGRIGCQLSGDGDSGLPANMALKPDWLPKWFWAQTYPGNVVGQTIPEPGVYPTPMYESVMAVMIFAAVMALRNHRFYPGWLFWFAVLLAGLERLAIEQIRVNSKYSLFGLNFTQAELISSALILVAGYFLYRLSRIPVERKKTKKGRGK